MERFVSLGGSASGIVLAAALLFGWVDGSALLDKAAGTAGSALNGIWPIQFYSSDPHVRMEQLLRQSEDLRKVENEWRALWFVDQPAHQTPTRVHGGIRP